MKKLYSIFILVLFACTAQAQTSWDFPFPVDSVTHEVSYQGIIQVPNTTMATLYTRAKTWHARIVETATQVPVVADEAAGLFIGKRVVMMGDKRFVYTVAVQCHDGQYEYLFTQFELLTAGTSTPTGTPGRNFITLPKMMTLSEVAKAPANLTRTGETRPAIQKLLTQANLTFEQVVGTLQQAMANGAKS